MCPVRRYDPKEIAQLRRDVVLYRGQTKDLSVKLKSMASLEAELRSTSAAYETLQNAMADKDKMLRDIERCVRGHSMRLEAAN